MFSCDTPGLYNIYKIAELELYFWGSCFPLTGWHEPLFCKAMNNKRPKQTDIVLSFLRERGERGVFNYEFVNLMPPIFRYSARIFELRQEGYDIRMVKVSRGVTKFILFEFKEEPINEEAPASQLTFCS